MWTVQSSLAHSSVSNGGSTVGELIEPLNPSPFFTGITNILIRWKGVNWRSCIGCLPAVFIIWPCLTLLLNIRHGKISFKCCAAAFNFHLQRNRWWAYASRICSYHEQCSAHSRQAFAHLLHVGQCHKLARETNHQHDGLWT